MSPAAQLDVRQAYEAALTERGYQSDSAQRAAVDRLQRMYDELVAFKSKRSNAFKKLVNRPDVPRGVWMFGGVGRGKSFLMDCFYASVPVVRKNRVHFHEFMRGVHRELDELKGSANPLDEVARRIARHVAIWNAQGGRPGEVLILVRQRGNRGLPRRRQFGGAAPQTLGEDAHQHQCELRQLLQRVQELLFVEHQRPAVLARRRRRGSRDVGDGRHFAEYLAGQDQLQRLARQHQRDIAFEQQIHAGALGEEAARLVLFDKNPLACRKFFQRAGDLEKRQSQLGVVQRGGLGGRADIGRRRTRRRAGLA